MRTPHALVPAHACAYKGVMLGVCWQPCVCSRMNTAGRAGGMAARGNGAASPGPPMHAAAGVV